MKILEVIPSYWPATQFGGTIFSSHALNKELVKKGVDLTVYTTNVGIGGTVDSDSETIVDGVKVKYFGFNKFFEVFNDNGWLFSTPLTNALKETIGRFDIVYIVSIWGYPTAIAAYYCRKYGKPYIISPRGVFYPYTMEKAFWKKWPYYHLFIKNSLRNANAIHYTSEDEAEQSNSFLKLKNKHIVVPNGIESDKFSGLPPKEDLIKLFPSLRAKRILLFLGRLHQKKGLDILTEAFARIADEEPNTHLLIVGNGEPGYRKKIENLVEQLRIKDKVTFAGALNGVDKLRAYSGSDIFILSSYSENFGMAVVEAMACGLPVVISDQVGISREIKVSDSGIVVAADTEGVYNGIKKLLGDDNLRQIIAKNAKTLIREFYDIDKVADKMIETFIEVIARQNDT